jgi:hypothetical protein
MRAVLDRESSVLRLRGKAMKPLKYRMTTEDYLYCNTCKSFCDLWKYGDVESAGHADCDWRSVTKTELKECVEECEEDGCFEEEFL